MKYIVQELLDKIKAKYENHYCKPTITYQLVLQSCSGDSPICDIDQEYVMRYDDLCVRMFDLDVSGWEVMRVEDSLKDFISPYKYDIVEFIIVTITLCRKL
jgi:hypothetical protein